MASQFLADANSTADYVASDPDPFAPSIQGGNPPDSIFASFPAKVNLPPHTGWKQMLATEKSYQSAVARTVWMELSLLRRLTNRNPTQEETDALVSAADRKTAIQEAILPTTLFAALTGVGFGWSDKGGVSFDLRRFGRAHFRRHINALVGSLFIVPWVMLGLSETTFVYKLRKDPRLRRYSEQEKQMTLIEQAEAMKKVKKERQALFNELPRRIREQEGTSAQRQAMSSQPERSFERPPQGTEEGSDDQFPSYSDNERIQQPAQVQQPQRPWSQPAPAESASSSLGILDDDDDTWPVSSPNTSASTPKQPAPGNAWERLRRRATSGEDPTQTQSQKAFRPDPFNNQGWSKEPATDRSREQAQREFDRLLEAERNVGSGGAAGGKRW